MSSIAKLDDWLYKAVMSIRLFIYPRMLASHLYDLMTIFTKVIYHYYILCQGTTCIFNLLHDLALDEIGIPHVYDVNIFPWQGGPTDEIINKLSSGIIVL